MGETVKDFVSPDAIFDKLFEAAPVLSWHVAPAALAFTRSATEFACIYLDPAGFCKYPENAIGRMWGAWVYRDAELQGRTIELRSNGDVLSAITLEPETVLPPDPPPRMAFK